MRGTQRAVSRLSKRCRRLTCATTAMGGSGASPEPLIHAQVGVSPNRGVAHLDASGQTGPEGRGIYKGDVGVAALGADLDAPDGACRDGPAWAGSSVSGPLTSKRRRAPRTIRRTIAGWNRRTMAM